MLCEPVVVNVHVSAAVPLAKVVADAAAGTTATGLPIGVPPSENVTVPLGPTTLLLWELIVAVNVIGVPELTLDTLATVAVAVVAFVTVTLSVVAAAGGM
jgi:hypothetical protein